MTKCHTEFITYTMFYLLEQINERPKPFEFYSAEDLWNDEYTSQQMLNYHLNDEIDVSSRQIKFIEHSVEWINSQFGITKDTNIIDFGCGPGLYTTRLAKKGANVTGIDFSSNSIQYAKKTADELGLKIDYLNQNYLEFQTDKKFDLVLMIMCDFCALSFEQRKLMVNKFYSILKPGGAVLLDVYSLNAFDNREESATYELNQLDSFWSADKYYAFVNTFKYPDEKVTLDKYTIVEAARTRTVYNWLQHFTPETLQAEFTAVGFEITNLYSNVAGSQFLPTSDEFAIVAKKNV